MRQRRVPAARRVAVDVAVVGADDEQPAAVGGRALDGAADVHAPAAVARSGVERGERAVLGAEVERAVDEQGGGLGARADAVAPDALAVGAAHGDHDAAERGDVEARSSSAGLVASGGAIWRVQRRLPVLGLSATTPPLAVSMKTPLSSTTGGNSASESRPAPHTCVNGGRCCAWGFCRWWAASKPQPAQATASCAAIVLDDLGIRASRPGSGAKYETVPRCTSSGERSA